MAAISIPAFETQSATPPSSPKLHPVTTPDKFCILCSEGCENEFSYGKLYEYENIVAHYYCLLLSSNMQQKGEDSEGIFGFLPVDIRKEVARGRTLRCYYCKNKGATIGCCSNRCKRVFHLPCGRKNDSLHQFFAEFRSFCGDHRLTLNVRKLEIPQDAVCNICLEVFKPKPSISTVNSLLAFCCKKWFHRICIQKFALNSGYFFKCPMCNNKPLFQRGMQDHGIFIPEQDASWELEPGAYRELLDRHNQCDAKPCVCPKGRNMNTPGTRWELVLCSSCGSQGMHVRCGNLNFKNPVWECSVCVSAHTRVDFDDDEQYDGTNATRLSSEEAIVEIEDSDDDDDVQIISWRSSNEENCAVVCIDDEGGSPLQLMKSDTTLATPDGGAISVMTIAASDNFTEVVGDINITLKRQQGTNPSSYTTPQIVSVVGGAQMIDDDDDDEVIETVSRKLPDSSTAVESTEEVLPPPKRVKTAADTCLSVVPTTTSVSPASSAGVKQQKQTSLPLGITRQLQNMIIVSQANSAPGQQNVSQVQLLSPHQQQVVTENQSQFNHVSIPVAGVDRAGSVINLQVMFPPGGMINLVQTPYSATDSSQMPTLQFIQGVFSNGSVPFSSQSNSSGPEPSARQSSNIRPPPTSSDPPPHRVFPQPMRTTTTPSVLNMSQTTAAPCVTSPTQTSEVTWQAPDSPSSVQTNDAHEDDDVQIVREFPPDVNNRSLLKPCRGSPSKQQPPANVVVSVPEDDTVVVEVMSRESLNQSGICKENSARSQDAACGESANVEMNACLIQKDVTLPGSSTLPQSAYSGKISGARSCSPNGGTSGCQVKAKEAFRESLIHCSPETTSAAGPSNSQVINGDSQRFASPERSRNNRAELIPSFIPISALQFSHLSDSRLKVIVNREFVIPVTKDVNCFHNTSHRRRSQNSRYATETRKFTKSSHRTKLFSTNAGARNSLSASSSSIVSGERLVMRPISDQKTNSPSKSRVEPDSPVTSGEKSQQGNLNSAVLPTSAVDSKIPTACGEGQENISPSEVCGGLNVILEKMDSEIFGNESAIDVNNFPTKTGQYRKRKRKYARLRLSSYSHKKK